MVKNWNQMNKRQQKTAVESTKSRMGRVCWTTGNVPPSNTNSAGVRFWCSTKNWVVTKNDAHPVSANFSDN